MKSQPTETPPQTASSFVSGKLVIVGVLSVAIIGAVTSWLYRYNATHRAAEFWGTKAARLIRDANQVLLCLVLSNDEGKASPADTLLLPDKTTRRIVRRRDLSTAPGILHLRNALLEDRSFEWPATNNMAPGTWQCCLVFSDSSANEVVYVWFSRDLKLVTHSLVETTLPTVLSCQPISTGLKEFFDEQFAVVPPSR